MEKWTAERVKYIQKIAYETDVQSLNVLVHATDEACDTEIGDLVISNENPFKEFEEKLNREFLLKLVEQLSDPRAQKVIKLRYGLDSSGVFKTLEEISDQYNVTRERIRQIESKALKELAFIVKKQGLKYEDFI